MKFTILVSLVYALIGMPLADSAVADPVQGSTKGKGEAPFALAVSFFTGQGAPKDEVLAAHYFRLAADQGNLDAQNMLGMLHKSGQGVSKDNHEAVKWFRMAAVNGDAGAQNNLGVMYNSGQGVAQDFKEAVKWFRLAADQGYADAQNNLAVAYDDGQGAPKSRVIAYALFNVAAAGKTSNDESVVASRTSVAASMSRAELDEAQALTREMARAKKLLAVLDEYVKKLKTK